MSKIFQAVGLLWIGHGLYDLLSFSWTPNLLFMLIGIYFLLSGAPFLVNLVFPKK
ncbi:MAG: hypothetical protein U0175_17305 [Caldilineaceae bacterium]